MGNNYRYRVHDTTGDDLGQIEHCAYTEPEGKGAGRDSIGLGNRRERTVTSQMVCLRLRFVNQESCRLAAALW